MIIDYGGGGGWVALLQGCVCAGLNGFMDARVHGLTDFRMPGFTGARTNAQGCTLR